jgi:hypothetical protein
MIRRMLVDGYREDVPVLLAPASATPLAQALEAALIEQPDNLSTHQAYGDYLREQGIRGGIHPNPVGPGRSSYTRQQTQAVMS